MVKSTWRSISTQTYIIAGIITFLIFTLGITLGLLIKDYRFNLVDQINKEQEIDYLSLQLQYLYLTTFSNNKANCPILATTLIDTIADLSDSLSEIIQFEEENSDLNKRKQLVQRRYLLDNVRYWLLAQESQKKCNFDTSYILYFYTSDCSSCPNQGTILSYYKKIHGEQLLIFPINLDLEKEEPVIRMLRSQFNVTSYPTLIINNQKYEGVIKKDELGKIICNTLNNSDKC